MLVPLRRQLKPWVIIADSRATTGAREEIADLTLGLMFTSELILLVRGRGSEMVQTERRSIGGMAIPAR